MRDLPSVSVVIATCRRPRFFAEALASVAAQHLPPQEVIVVDDGGGRGEMGEAIPRLPLPVRVIPGPGRGPGAARNAGLAAAAGELIAFLDDDDLWRPQKLARQVPWFLRRPSLGLLATSIVRGRAAAWGRALPPRPGWLRTVSLASLVRANRFATSSVVVRKECVRLCGGFEESLALAQDWDLWLRIAARWETAVLPAPLTWYRLHQGQRSGAALAMRRAEIAVLSRAAEREGAPAERLIRRRLAWARCRAGSALLREGRPREAVQMLAASVRANPLGVVAWGRLARGWMGVQTAKWWPRARQGGTDSRNPAEDYRGQRV